MYQLHSTPTQTLAALLRTHPMIDTSYAKTAMGVTVMDIILDGVTTSPNLYTLVVREFPGGAFTYAVMGDSFDLPLIAAQAATYEGDDMARLAAHIVESIAQHQAM